MREEETAGTTANEEAPPSASGGWQLIVMEQRSLARYPLREGQTLRIGRAEDCDIVLRDPMASRVHATLKIGPQLGLELEEMGSRNGTRVRNEPVPGQGRVQLSPGDSIRIGNAILVVQVLPGIRRDPTAAPALPRSSARVQQVVLRDPAMAGVYDLVQRIAPGSISVLILGETGVGKELIAEAIHGGSGARSQGPFVRINCAAVSESLFESELFGHERGSFTGAVRAKPGLLEAANTGTAFLDEVGELPLAAQAKLLRALEAREITRVGGLNAQAIDLRFIAATNRDLRAEIARGAFREDLFFRLAGVSVTIPPLRQRPSEVGPLVEEFLALVAAQLDRAPPRVSAAAMSVLRNHDWPGNIRELRNVVECAVLRANGEDIEVADLPPELLEPSNAYTLPWGTNHASSTMTPPPEPGREASLTPAQEQDRDRMWAALQACNGNQTRAAKELGMPRRTFVAKLGTYGMPRPRKRSPTPRP